MIGAVHAAWSSAVFALGSGPWIAPDTDVRAIPAHGLCNEPVKGATGTVGRPGVTLDWVLDWVPPGGLTRE
jgi:hypothetical protein